MTTFCYVDLPSLVGNISYAVVFCGIMLTAVFFLILLIVDRPFLFRHPCTSDRGSKNIHINVLQ